MRIHFEKGSMLLNFIRIAVEKRVAIEAIRAMQAKPTRKLISLAPKPVKSFGIFVLRVSALCLTAFLGWSAAQAQDLGSALDEQSLPDYRVLPVSVLSPEIRETALTESILVLTPDVLAPFLGDPLLMDEVSGMLTGRVITGPEGNVLLGQFSPFLAQDLPVSKSGLYTVFREGDTLTHPVSGEYLATMAHVVGVARLDSPGEIAALTMIRSAEEAVPGDHLIAYKAPSRNAYLYPAPAELPFDAYVLSTFGIASGAGGYSLVAISVGSQDGIRPGHLLSTRYPEQTILLTSKIVSPARPGDNCRITDAKEAVYVRMLRCDERLPSQRELLGRSGELLRLPEGHAGELMVIRVFDRVSYALVRSAERAVQVGDRVVSPDT